MYNYKEPFMEYTGGYGYQGILVFDGETDKVQCHLCGEWYHALGNHLNKEHNMRANQYKDEVGLRQTTALIGEKFRQKLIANGIQTRMKNLRPGGKLPQATKDKIRSTMKNNTLQGKNERGTCPLQLLDRLQKKATELGRTPTTDEISFIEALRMTYGSYAKACEIIGLEIRKTGQTLPKTPKISKEEFIKVFTKYFIDTKKFPNTTYLSQVFRVTVATISKYLKLYGRKNIIKDVCVGENIYQHLPEKLHLDKVDLLELARNFKEVNGRNPSTSDCKRGLLPHASKFLYYFGSWKNVTEQI
jgi:hypothetical protein